MTNKLRIKDPHSEREILLIGTMAVGRDPRCDISDSDPLLSRRHAEFIVSDQGVTVRDLGSRNGIQVNGRKVPEAALKAGDVVQVAHLTITLVIEGDKPAGAEAGEDKEDKTALVTPPLVAPAAPAPPAATPPAPVPPAVDEDKTRVILPPPAAAPPPVPPPRAAPAPPPAPVAPSAAEADDDRTRYTPPPPGAAARAPREAGDVRIRPEPAARPVPVAAPVAAQAAPAVEGRKPRAARTSWAARVFLSVLLLASVVFLVTTAALRLWHARVLNAVEMSRATALGNWLAGEASAALEADAGVGAAADAVSREPDVAIATVMTPDGRVIAPSTRSFDLIARIPGIGAPSEVFRLRTAWNGDKFEVARPVSTRNRPRAAIAWVEYRPALPPEAGNSVVYLAPALLVALVGGWLVAVRIRGTTLQPLVALNEDIDLAMGGQLETVSDPMGAKPVKELADIVNYVLARMKAGGSLEPRPSTSARPAEVAPAPPSPTPGRRPAPIVAARSPAPSTPPTARIAAPRAVEAKILANALFRVTDASPDCAELLGVRPDALVGQHLLDAIPDKEVVDAILKCLGAIGTAGEERTTVPLAGRPYELLIIVSRPAKDQPMTITMRAAGAA